MQPNVKQDENNISLYRVEDKVIKLNRFKADKTIDLRTINNGKNDKKSHGAMWYLNDGEIVAVMNEYRRIVQSATSKSKEFVARRNICMFVCSLSVGMRGGDFVQLKYKDVFNVGWQFRSDSTYTPQKTKNIKKVVDLDFTTDFKKAIIEFMNWKRSVGVEALELDEYIFTTYLTNKDHISKHRWWEINSATCKSAGIEQKIGTHGLRKTMGRSFVNANISDYDRARWNISKRLGHSNVKITDKYLCIEREQIKEQLDNIPSYY